MILAIRKLLLHININILLITNGSSMYSIVIKLKQSVHLFLRSFVKKQFSGIKLLNIPILPKVLGLKVLAQN